MISSSGTVTPCCKITNYDAPSLNNYFGDKKIHEIKQQLLNNVPPVQCQTCVDEETVSGHSLRTMTEQFESHETEIRAINQANYFNIKNLDIITSNVCNLQCLPCQDSSFVRSMELKTMGLRKQLPIKRVNPVVDLEQVTNFGSVENLTLLGGEPFADRVTFELLEKLVASGKSKNIRIDLNTNLTMVTREKLLILKNNFKEVIIKGSIDGVEQYHNYLRYPGQWEDITAAVELIKELEIPFLIITALSNLSLLRYDQVIKWAEEQQIVDLFVTKVINPSVLAYTRLPQHVKQQLLSRYIELKNSKFNQSRTTVAIDACIQTLKEPGCTQEQWKETIHWIKKHDQHRGTDYIKLWPELNE
jgi:sulfatase maturation enzyme AslB (radical SAM superfamily)